MNEYTEAKLVEKPAIELFQSLGYEHHNCFHEKFGDNGTLGREIPSEVVLVSRLESALFRLNSNLSEEATDLASDEPTRDRSSQNPEIANRELYRMLKDGLKVWIRVENGSEEVETVKVIDVEHRRQN